MKNLLFVYLVLITLSCGTSNTLTLKKEQAYGKIYEQNVVVIAPLPPINKTNNVEAKEFLYSTLTRPLAEQGYYVIPAFLSMELFKNESAYDTELFIDGDLKRFGTILGADAVLFTIIHKWEKAALNGTVNVDIEYILKSTKDNSEIFSRRGDITYDVSSSQKTTGFVGALLDMAVNALNAATTDYISVARSANIFTLSDMPAGTYSASYGADKQQTAGEKNFSATVHK